MDAFVNIFESKPELLELTRTIVRNLAKRNQIRKMQFQIVVNKVFGSMSKIVKYSELSENDRRVFKEWIRCLLDEID